MLRNEEQQRIILALRSLPRRQRECVVLHYYEDCSDREIASTLRISRGTVKTHLHRARAALAHELKELQ